MANKYYAIKYGRIEDHEIFNQIVTSWDECKAAVNGVKNAKYKSFATKDEAEKYLSDETDLKTCNTEIIIPKDDNQAIAFVDGSFNPKTKVYGAGVLIFYGDGTIQTFIDSGKDPEMVSMRNVAGEILAATHAIRIAEEHMIKFLTIYYDYEGIKHWATGEWAANKKKTKEYVKTIEQAASDGLYILFHHVKAHTGVEYNEKVDQLAKEACGIK
jgi:ribonuclease HI